MKSEEFWKAFAAPLGLLVLFVIAFYGVFALFRSISRPPSVAVDNGTEIVTDQAEVPLTGKVTRTNVLYINDKQVAVASDGTFSDTVPVSPGENTIKVVAGSTVKVTENVKVTREEQEKAVTSTTTINNNTNLTTSGPVESVMGSVGLAALLLSLGVYRRSTKRNTLQKA